MGLGFYAEGYSGVPPHWSYTGFLEFRQKIARSLNLDLEEMKGFRKKHPIDTTYFKLGYRDWESVKSPLKTFLTHSDCEGELSPTQCNMTAIHLKPIILLWECRIPFDKDEHDIFNGLRLIEMMEHCYNHGTPLVFC